MRAAPEEDKQKTQHKHTRSTGAVTHTHNCGHAWLCNYRGESLVSQLQLSGSAAPCGTQNAAGRGCRTMEQHCTRAGKLHTCIQWNLRVRRPNKSHRVRQEQTNLLLCMCSFISNSCVDFSEFVYLHSLNEVFTVHGKITHLHKSVTSGVKTKW